MMLSYLIQSSLSLFLLSLALVAFRSRKKSSYSSKYLFSTTFVEGSDHLVELLNGWCHVGPTQRTVLVPIVFWD